MDLYSNTVTEMSIKLFFIYIYTFTFLFIFSILRACKDREEMYLVHPDVLFLASRSLVYSSKFIVASLYIYIYSEAKLQTI